MLIPNPDVAKVEREILVLVRERNIAQQQLRSLCAGSEEHSAVKRTLRNLEHAIGRLEWRRRGLPRTVKVMHTISPPPQDAA